MLPHRVDTDQDHDDIATVSRQRRICNKYIIIIIIIIIMATQVSNKTSGPQ